MKPGRKASPARATAKQRVRALLDDLPDDASLEEIQYHLYVRELVESRSRQLPTARVISQEEAERRLARWLGK